VRATQQKDLSTVSENFLIVREAIVRRLQVTAVYKGHRRWMCPHVLGWKNGREQGLFYQFDGTSNSGIIRPGSPDNWRCIPIEAMKQVATSAGEWHTAWNHSRPQTCVRPIEVEIDY
jgi:hypothetical protein